MQIVRFLFASAFFGVVFAATTKKTKKPTKFDTDDVVGTACSAKGDAKGKELPQGYCCCEVEENEEVSEYQILQQIGTDTTKYWSIEGITVRGRKDGEPDNITDIDCDSPSAKKNRLKKRSKSSSKSKKRKASSSKKRRKKTSSSSKKTCKAPKKIENWCEEQEECQESITCEEEECEADFRIFNGCTCTSYCALTETCCPECRMLCEKAAIEKELENKLANSCASSCVGTPLGGSCSCAPTCVMSGDCCADFFMYCGAEVSKFFTSLNKGRGDGITKNDLSFAVGRMLVGREGNQRRRRSDGAEQLVVSQGIEQAFQDGKTIANCLLEISKGLQMGDSLSETDLDVLCKATPLESVKGRSLSVDEWNFLKGFCSFRDSETETTTQMGDNEQVGLCLIGQNLTEGLCGAEQLAHATILMGGSGNTHVLARAQARRQRSQLEEDREKREAVLEEPCRESNKAIRSSDNAKALQKIKKIRAATKNESKPQQSAVIRNFQELHDLAILAQESLTSELNQIAIASGGLIEAKTVGVKTLARASDKIAADYQCNWRQITDLCRGTLRTTCGSSCNISALLDAYDQVDARNMWKYLENHWANPSATAYADLSGLVSVRVKGIDVICELQMQLHDIEIIKNGKEHALHKIRSQLLKGALDGKAASKTPSVVKLDKQVFELYQNVWNECFGLEPYSGTDASTPMPKPGQ